MDEAHPVAIPVDQHQDLSLETPSNQSEIVNAPYKEAIGSLLYLAMVSRPDIAYAVNTVSQYAEKLTKEHWNAVKRIIKYIKGTIDYGIKFEKNQNLELRAYSDAGFAGDKATRRSTTGYVILLGNTPIGCPETEIGCFVDHGI
ncbi:hypothetical protein RF55_6975 [Lasius niger]|uniref:Retrovirus-related pol polyprotein from transposon tnt 1-94 n=1 Tax=Lasius niger TaxID=67767 RepID=A0A0J7KRQ2_LASNI|nr:hypothetical protein RF55_6975 [Lasius niger]